MAYFHIEVSIPFRAAYQDFFTIWKDADPGIPVLKEVQAEHIILPNVIDSA